MAHRLKENIKRLGGDPDQHLLAPSIELNRELKELIREQNIPAPQLSYKSSTNVSEIQKKVEEVIAEHCNQLIRLNTEEIVITRASPSLHSVSPLESASSGKIFYNERMISNTAMRNAHV